MSTNVIKHSEICNSAAMVLKTTPENVDKVVNQYSASMTDLINQRKPTNKNDITLVETVFAAFKVKYNESGIKKNPDGTETKVGANYSVAVALPNTLLELINAGVKVVETVVTDSKKKISA